MNLTQLFHPLSEGRPQLGAHTMYDRTDEDDIDDGAKPDVTKLTISYPDSLHEEILRQLDDGVHENVSRWFRDAAHTHASLMTFYSDAEAAEHSTFAVILGYGDGHEPQKSGHRVSISVPKYQVDRAEEAIDRGIVDSKAEWFRDAALTKIAVQQLAFLAGADKMSEVRTE